MTSQASNLPPSTYICSWYGVPRYPTDVQNLNKWIFYVREELASHGLQDLIKTDIPRPKHGEPGYHQWVLLSTKVGHWMKAYLDNRIYHALSCHIAYADDVIRALKALKSVPVPQDALIDDSASEDSGSEEEEEEEEPEKTRNQPPKDTNPHQYAHTWRQVPSQTAPNGNCSYCDGENHGAASCFYLGPETRPADWTPEAGLWYLDGSGDECGDDSSSESTMSSTGVDTPETSCVGIGEVQAGAAEPVIHVTSSVPITDIWIKLSAKA